MVPVAGSAYTYSYAVLGELIAWMVGWALILEYAVAAGAVAVGWSGYANGFLRDMGWGLPLALTAGPADTIMLADGTTAKGGFNLIAFLVSLLITWLLVLGTSKSAKFTAALVLVKVAALTAFIIVALPATAPMSAHSCLRAMPRGSDCFRHEGVSPVSGGLRSRPSSTCSTTRSDRHCSASRAALSSARSQRGLRSVARSILFGGASIQLGVPMPEYRHHGEGSPVYSRSIVASLTF